MCFFSSSFFILASFQPGSSYHLLPDHTLLLVRWSTPSCGQSGHCFWEPGWSRKSGQHLLLQWLGQPRRSETQFQNQLMYQVLLHLKLFWKVSSEDFHHKICRENIKITVYQLNIYLTVWQETRNFSAWIGNRPRD